MANTDLIFRGPLLIDRAAVFDKLMDLMITAGWTSISSDVLNDGYIMYSNGIDGSKNIYVRMGSSYYGTWNNPTYDVRLTTNTNIRIDLLKSYTPSQDEENPKGKFVYGDYDSRGAGEFSFTFLRYNPTVNNVTYELFYYIDKERCVFILYPPISSGYGYQPTIFGFGLPAKYYLGKPDSARDTILFANTSPYIYIHDYPRGFGTASSFVSAVLTKENIFANPDWLGRFKLSPIIYHSTTNNIGFIGEIPGIKSIEKAVNSFVDRDEVTLDSAKYRIIKDVSSNKLSDILAIRVE